MVFFQKELKKETFCRLNADYDLRDPQDIT